MRAAILALTIVLCTPSIGHAVRIRIQEPTASPSAEPLPLRGNIFIDPIGESPHIRWVKGYGETKLERAGTFTRIDYVANDGSVADIDGIVYTFSLAATAGHPTRSLSLHRSGGRCGTIRIALDDTAAAMKVRLTRGDRVEDYWLVSTEKRFVLFPTCDPLDVPMNEGQLEVFVTLATGIEKRLGTSIPVARIPIWTADAAEAVVDWSIVNAFSLLLLVARAGALLRPCIAVHGLTEAGYLPRLRFRVRLPRARIHQR